MRAFTMMALVDVGRYAQILWKAFGAAAMATAFRARSARLLLEFISVYRRDDGCRVLSFAVRLMRRSAASPIP